MTKPRHDQGPDYERGFIDGMQHQMQSSVDKAVNRMAQRTWVGLTDDDVIQTACDTFGGIIKPEVRDNFRGFYAAIEAKLKEKNT